MIKLVVSLGIVALGLASAAVVDLRKPRLTQYSSQVPAIINQRSSVEPDGSYQYSYETENGIAAQEQGRQGPAEGTVAQGGFRYVSPEGTPVVVQYVADENGFQPSSDVLPVGPEIPEAILRSLAYNAEHPEQEVEPPKNSFKRRAFKRAVAYRH
ncbi:endocuticle structural glycoprotein SgAbd-1-like [Euwallacea similis]|uniref:endocuticle structural glycoprotein SgAbd-1-like n=1 Tax=Euwallacea similis TaxID=1736056 RepID=UPI00344FFB97